MKRLKPSTLKALREAVSGHYSEVAALSKKSIAMVSQVMNGNRHSNEILDAAIEVKERIDRENASRESRILSKTA